MKFPGYTVVEQLGETHHFCVYKARKTDTDKTVIIKVLRLKSPSPLDRARIKHEYERFRNLNIKGITTPTDLFMHGDDPALVRDDVSGISIKDMIAEGMTIDRFLGCAIRLSEILGQLHCQNLFHRNIKPRNILVDTATGTLTITDIGIEPIPTQIYEEINHPDMIHGVLPYLSPEQTGRMNRQPDYRTDLYSLGVTFYEMLTGRVPFSSENPLEIIHGHMAQTPESPSSLSPHIPEPVSEIVLKLLSKSPSDRYHHCQGLTADLRECLRRLNNTGSISPFPIASKDVSLHFQIPENNAGRKKELVALHDAFEQSCKGKVAVVMVAGEPGVGKTALIQEFHKSILLRPCYFVSGKYDQYHRTIPFSAIIQAIRNLIRQIMGESNDRVDFLKKKIRKSVGQNGKIITDIIPEIEGLIGSQPENTGLGPEETRNRFNLFFKEFIKIFADRDHPLILFFDDLQWADHASHKLIAEMVSDPDLKYTLFLGTYRDNEVNVHHPVRLTRDIVIKHGRPVHMIHLAPLAPDDIASMLVTFLSKDHELLSDQVQIIYDKTRGNPFFINQFLKLLHDKNYLVRDYDLGWLWDLEGARSLGATENVVMLMAAKLRDLPEEMLSTLALCACLGNPFDLTTVSAVSGRSMDETVSIVSDLMDHGLIIPANQEYKFYHNRIQEVAYSLLSQSDREKNHYTIGRMILDQTPESSLLSRIFEICDHLNLAGSYLSSPEEQLSLAELNLKAGIKAKNSTAYDAAVSYLDKGRYHLSSDAWESCYDLTFTLFSELMECMYLNHDFDKAEQLFQLIVTNARAPVDKAKAYKIMITLYTLRKKPEQAIAMGIEGLKLFDIHLKTNVRRQSILIELIKLKYRLKRIGLNHIADLPVMSDKTMVMIQELLAGIGVPSFYVNPNLLALSTLMGVSHFLKHGLTARSSVTLIMASNVFQTVLDDDTLSNRLGEIALNINKRFDNPAHEAITLHIFAYFRILWQQNVSAELDIYPKVYELSMNSGNFIFAGNALGAEVECRTRFEQPLDQVLAWLDSHRDFILKIDDANVYSMYQLNRSWIRTLLGHIAMDEDLSDDEFNFQSHLNQAIQEKEFFKVFLSYYMLIQLRIRQKKWPEARQVAMDMERFIVLPTSSYQTVKASFLACLAYIAHARYHSWGKGDKKRVRAIMAKLKKWARLSPDNFKHTHDLAQAEMHRMKGHAKKAIILYHDAIEGARKNGFLSDAALACELLGDYYLSLELNDEAGEFLRRAHSIYVAWGAHALARNLEKDFPEISGLAKPGSENSTTQSSSTDTWIANIDLATVMKVSRIISKEIMMDRLLGKTIHLCVTNAGAERGSLIFESDKGLIVQASIEVKTDEKKISQALPLDDFDGACSAIVKRVLHTGKTLILDHASEDGPFTEEIHVLSRNCKSVLCMPLMHKGRRACILYMENNLIPNIFTPERLEILKLIAAQSAISIQNAGLYKKISNEIEVRKQAEDDLMASEDKYRSILEEMQDSYCETDLLGNILFFNPSACTITGYTAEELIGTPIQNLIQPSDRNKLESYYSEIFSSQAAGKPIPCQLIGKNNSLIPLEVVTSLIRNKNGDIIGFRNVGRDVSDRIRLEHDLLESSKSVQSARIITIMGLAKLAEYRDEATGSHLERIREYARVLTRELAKHPEYSGYITEEYIEDIYNSSILHDIGKVGVPDAILLKPGKLTHEEFAIIKTHTTLGGNALKAIETKIEGQTFLTLGREIAYYHHEKWDGSGYPKGLKGTDIPLSARIVALADVYDALTSKRVYKEAFTHQEAVDIIVKDRGTHFDPDVVDAFLEHLEDFRRIREELFDDAFKGQEAV